MRTKDFANFILERERIRVKKEAGKPRPWTKDPILDKYRFCNVRREDDAVTRWIHQNWLQPHKDEPHLWFAMVVARLFNNPATLREIGFPLPYKPEKLRAALHRIKARGDKVFNGAYIVSTNGKPGDKIDYLFEHVLGPLWAERKQFEHKDPTGWTRALNPECLTSYHARLMQFDGLGSFMAAQVIADIKHVAPFTRATDWHTFAASGPGSRRGLNWVMERPFDTPWPGASWKLQLDVVRDIVNARLAKHDINLDGQNVQNGLCELFKYAKVLEGVGTPKQLYRPADEPPF